MSNMAEPNAVPTFTNRLQFRIVGDSGLLVTIDGAEDLVARGIPQAFMLKVDGRRTLDSILGEIDEELAVSRELIRRSVEELIEDLSSKGGLEMR